MAEAHELYDAEDKKFILPEADYSGEEVALQKTQKRLWVEQSVVWALLLVPLTVGVVMAVAAPSVELKFGWSGWSFAIFVGMFSGIVLTARGGLAGKQVILSETYKQLSDFPEQRKIKQIHLVAAPKKAIDIKPFKEQYQKQIEKYILESEALVETEGKIAMGMIDQFEKDGYVVLRPDEYDKLTSNIIKLNDDLARIQLDLAGIEGEADLISVLNEEDETTRERVKKVATEKGRILQRVRDVHHNLKISTAPTTKKADKVLQKVEELLNERYEIYIKG